MFKIKFSGHNKIWGAMRSGGYRPGSRYKKLKAIGLLYRTNFQSSHRLKQRQSRKERQRE